MRYPKKLLRYFTTLGMLLFCALTVVNAQSPEKIARKALDSTVLLKMRRANGFSQGSGFFIDDGLIATNYHVIRGAKSGTAKLVRQEQQFTIEGHIAIDQHHDLAILKVTGLRAPALPLGDSDTVQVGETVYAVGNPRGLEGTFSQGNISSIRPEGNALVRGKILQITAPISPGSSGGAVLNGKGKVIGIAVATRVDGQNLNFAIPSNYLKGLREQSRTVKTLGEDTPTGVKRFLLNLFILSTSVFVVIQVLPLAKVKGCSTAAGVALVFGILKSLLMRVLVFLWLQTGVLEFLSLPKTILMLGLSYVVINAFLLWLTSKMIRGFEISGFFKILSAAVLISIVESLLHWLIPGV